MTAPQPQNRRTPSAPGDRARETRDRLLAAGRRAFAAKGLAGTNLKADILEPAGVSVGSFYHQFKDKTELLLAILDRRSDDFRRRLRDVHRPGPGRSLVDVVRDSYSIVFAVAAEDDDSLRIQLRERDSADPRVRDFLASDRERWLRSLSEDFRRLQEASGIDVAGNEDVAELVMALAMGATSRYLEAPERDRPAVRERLLRNLVRFTVGGVPALLADEFPAGDLASDSATIRVNPTTGGT